MIKKNITFAIEDMQEVTTENSNEFSYAKIKCLSTMPNKHGYPISKEVLRNCADTVLGKWVIIDTKLGERATHTNNQVIAGVVPRDSVVEFVEEKDGNLSMVVDAVMSKIYVKQVYDMFKLVNRRNVSCEFVAKFDENENIISFNIVGITILGLAINGSCPNASMEMVQFSEKATEYYDKIDKTTLWGFSSNKINELEGTMEENKVDETVDVELAEETKKETDIVMEEIKDKEDEVEMATSEKEKFDEKEDKTDDEDKDEIEEFSLEKFLTKDVECSEEIKMCSADDIAKKFSELSKEIEELRAFKFSIEEEKRVVEEAKIKEDTKVKFESIMSTVKESIDEKTLKNLYEEGKVLTFSELDAFSNKVKAIAFDSRVLNSKKEEIIEEKQDNDIRFASQEVVINQPKVDNSLWGFN